MNMFKPTKAKTLREYIDAVPEGRRETIVALHEFIQKAVPKLKPHLTSSMIGYGSFLYKTSKNQSGTWPVVALANQKQYISVYVCAIANGQYIAEKHKQELGKVKVGRSCISFKKLEDLNLPALKKVLKEAEKHPGLVLENPKKK